MADAKEPAKNSEEAKAEGFEKYCGIVMPISYIKTENFIYNEGVFAAMRIVTEDAIRKAGLTPKPVWERGDSLQIKANIINSIFEYKYIVCIICGLNANVMTELGMAIAFGKHVVIVKDQYTECPFDVNEQAYIDYPTGLDYDAIQIYKGKVITQLQQMQKEGSKTFLAHYGKWKVLEKMPEQEMGMQEILNLMRNVDARLSNLETANNYTAIGPIMQDGEIFQFLEELLKHLVQLETDLANQPEYNPEALRGRYQKVADRIRHFERIKPSLMNRGDNRIQKYIEHIGVLYHQVAGHFNR